MTISSDFSMTSTNNGTSISPPRSRAGAASRSGSAARSSTDTAQRSVVRDAEATLSEQLGDERYIRLRSDSGEQFIENLQLPKAGDLWIPGYRPITTALARELGADAAFEDDPFSDLPLDQPQPASGAIDGNIVASFVDGVTGQQKIDVLNSCLLAQLAANAKFDRESKPVEWTKFYANVLENVGWVVPDFQFRGLRSNQARFTMDAVIIRLFTGLLSQNEMETVQAAIGAIKALEDGDGRLRIFSRNSAEGKAGNFQVTSVGVSGSGVLSMKVGAFGFQTSSNVTHVLWFSFSGNSTAMQVTKSTLVLNEQVHDRLRDAILRKLGNRGLDFIRGLELSDGP
jgi:hypothetical protein